MGRRVCIQTFGCQMNERDSETMEAVLQQDGHEILSSTDGADVVLLNSCSIREGAELKVLGRLRRLVTRKTKEQNFRVGVAGCMAQRLGGKLFAAVPGLDFVLGTRQFSQVGDALGRLETGESEVLLVDEVLPHDCHGNRRWNQLRPTAFVTIMSGCPMACTYCIVPRTRGGEWSRPMGEILDEVHRLAEHGVREVVLLGQIVNLYGLRQFPTVGGNSPFVQLLEKIGEIDGIERIRFLSPHPCGFREDLLRCFSEVPKICPSVHLPIQSGSNRILRLMKRGYTRERVLQIVHRLRSANPLLSISTDLIVGFPGETDEDFRQTEGLFDGVDFDMAYVFKYSPRSGTVAAAMSNPIPDDVASERNQILLDRLAATSLRRNKLFLSTTQQVLVERPSKKDAEIYIGHTAHQKKVFFPCSGDRLGQIVPVTIHHATISACSGRLIEGD